jgi:hypothetical protein
MSKRVGLTFDSGPYWGSHRRAPGGEGMWMFCPASKWNRADYIDFCRHPPHAMTLGGAKDWLRNVAGARGRWVVCP